MSERRRDDSGKSQHDAGVGIPEERCLRKIPTVSNGLSFMRDVKRCPTAVRYGAGGLNTKVGLGEDCSVWRSGCTH